MMDEVMPSEVLNKEYVRSVTANKGVQVKEKHKGIQVRTSNKISLTKKFRPQSLKLERR